MTKSPALYSLALLAVTLAKSIHAFESGWEYRQAANCSTIVEIICDADNNLTTETLCDAIRLAGLEDDIDTDTFTLFAPTDEAFGSLPENVVSELLDGDDIRGLIDLLAYHTVPERNVLTTDLKCDSRIFMGNEDYSVTICEGEKTFQVGVENPTSHYPEILSSNIDACNGIIHTISEVML